MTSPLQIIGAALAVATCVGAHGAAAQQPPGPLNSLKELGAALRACWVPPPLDQSRTGMQITVRLSYRRNGQLFGQPRITFEVGRRVGR